MNIEKQKEIAFQIIFGKTMMFLEETAKQKLDKNTYLNVFERLLSIQSILDKPSGKTRPNLHCETTYFYIFNLKNCLFKKYDYFYRKNIEKYIISNKIELNKYFENLSEENIFNLLKPFLEKLEVGSNIFKLNMDFRFIVKMFKEHPSLVKFL